MLKLIPGRLARVRSWLTVLMIVPLMTPLLAQAQTQGTMVRMYTTLGPVDVTLDSRAPRSVENFLAYVQSKAYDGTIIHRSPPDFVVQGGGYTVSTIGAQHIPTRSPIALECSLDRPNTRGTIAMARTAARDSATSEWFVNTNSRTDNNFLNCTPRVDGYAVFGRVTTPGMVAADAIAALPLTYRPRAGVNRPTNPLGFDDLPQITVRADGTLFLTDLVYVTSAVVLPTPAGDADRVLNFLEATYWQFLKPPGSVSATAEAGGVTYYYRYYPTTQSYVGVSVPGNVVFYLVPSVGPDITRFASLAEVMPAAIAAGY